MTLSTFAAVFGRQQEISIGIYCPQGAQQQTHGTLLLLSVDGTDRRTDERTPIDPAPHTMRAASKTGNAGILQMSRLLVGMGWKRK